MPRRTSAIQRRNMWARANQPYGDLLVNSPEGFPSGQPPVAYWWYGSDSIHSLPSPGAGMAAVTRATSLIVNTLSSLPIRKLTSDTSAFPRVSVTEMPLPRWVADPMLYRQDERFGYPAASAAVRMTAPAFWAEYLRSALLKGNGFLIHETDNVGQPLAGSLRILNPDYVTPQRAPEGYINRRIGLGDDYVETTRNGTFDLGGRVYHLVELTNPLSSTDEYGTAEGVLAMHARELGLASQEIEYGSGMFRSGVPAGYLTVAQPTVSEPYANQLKQQWMKAHGNDRRSIAVLNALVSFTPIQLSPLDAQLIESRMMSLLDISNAFGIPPHMLGAKSGDSMTYSNVESRAIDFRQYTLQPWATAFESVLSSLLPTGTYLEVDFRGFLRSDMAARYASYKVALEAGFLTVDEVRQLEGMAPMSSTPALEGAPDDETA